MQASPAAAVPQFPDFNYRCEGQTSVLIYGSFNPALTDVPTWATWGISDYTGYGGDAYATTRIRVVDTALPSHSRQAVTCQVALTGEVVTIVLLSPVPVAPPPSVYTFTVSATPAEPGRYQRWVVRSDVNNGCFAASPYGVYDDGNLRLFCLDAVPNLWDVVNIDYQPLGTSRLTVRGTLTSLKGGASR